MLSCFLFFFFFKFTKRRRCWVGKKVDFSTSNCQLPQRLCTQAPCTYFYNPPKQISISEMVKILNSGSRVSSRRDGDDLFFEKKYLYFAIFNFILGCCKCCFWRISMCFYNPSLHLFYNFFRCNCSNFGFMM